MIAKCERDGKSCVDSAVTTHRIFNTTQVMSQSAIRNFAPWSLVSCQSNWCPENRNELSSQFSSNPTPAHGPMISYESLSANAIAIFRPSKRGRLARSTDIKSEYQQYQIWDRSIRMLTAVIPAQRWTLPRWFPCSKPGWEEQALMKGRCGCGSEKLSVSTCSSFGSDDLQQNILCILSHAVKICK